ncbi:MAG: CDP-alcohol phosphatidyltransferase family protein [Ignavibacteriales bacterium]|nr:CDP-alcohol phosphatidyltransferase family protein [Ignavibacteriales bacterium]
MNKTWTISNGLSVVRILLVIPVVLLLTSYPQVNRWYVFGIIIVGALTDFLDGYFARKFNQVTDLGKILDPLADKISLGLLAVILAVLQILPVWFIVCVLLRDVLIFSGGMYIHRTKGIVLQSNWLGKWTAGALALLVAVGIFDDANIVLLKTILLILTTVMLLLSFISYAKRFIELMNDKHSPKSSRQVGRT